MKGLSRLMSPKKWFFAFVASALFAVTLIGMVNFIADPFQQYRASKLYPPYFGLDQRYMNPGLAKNYKYDFVIVGTSMTENIKTKTVRELYRCNPIKLSISGSTSKEQNAVLTTALATKQAKTVLWGLDIFSFAGSPESLRNGPNSLPTYLYDESYLNDWKYLLSLDTSNEFFKIMQNLALGLKKERFDRDNAFLTMEPKKPSVENIKQHWKNRSSFNKNFNKAGYSLQSLSHNFDTNALGLIKSNPNTQFIIFYPPYSILAWMDIKQKGWLKEALGFKKYVFESTKNLPNVTIVDFQDNRNITHNLTLYDDITHLLPQNYDALLLSLSRRESEVSKSNIDARLKELEKQIDELDANDPFAYLP